MQNWKFKIDMFSQLLIVCLAIAPFEIRGTVTKVIDGDTIDVMLETKTVRIRLAEIDSPESKQESGEESTAHLAKLILDKKVLVKCDGTVTFGRFVGTVYHENKSINARMVWDGFAWRYPAYSKSVYLDQLERSAKINKRGLWKAEKPIPPWEWRRQNQNKKRVQPRAIQPVPLVCLFGRLMPC